MEENKPSKSRFIDEFEYNFEGLLESIYNREVRYGRIYIEQLHNILTLDESKRKKAIEEIKEKFEQVKSYNEFNGRSKKFHYGLSYGKDGKILIETSQDIM